MIADAIVGLSLLFAAAFTLAWFVRPGLRSWIERPKYRFQADLERYDRHRRQGTADT
jgi:hypothetical protein